MTPAHLDHEQFIRDLYRGILRREPGDKELADWMATAGQVSDRDIVRLFVRCEESLAHSRVTPAFPPGHYHSPVVDPDEACKYVDFGRAVDAGELAGIELSADRMLKFWRENVASVSGWAFPGSPEAGSRYYADNGTYPVGDAIALSMMISAHRPSRIVEIGSGFSSACVLDALARAQLPECRVTLIDPDPARAKSLLRPGDMARVRIEARPVQEVSLEVFRDLQVSDLLIIDSTHVLKTGSDVCFELFSVLPALERGVLIHFHDVPYPFEYPSEWVVQRNYSWNEAYALRAFLMHNLQYEIIFYNTFFASRETEAIRCTLPQFLDHCGSSLWLRKIGRPAGAGRRSAM